MFAVVVTSIHKNFCNSHLPLLHTIIYVTGFAKRDLFDRFFKIELSSCSSATGIALNGVT